MDRLIYDRTIEDVNYAKENQDSNNFLKGAYNYIDLNRVEEWAQYLAILLNKHGYNVEFNPHQNQQNILENGSLINSADNWNINDRYTIKSDVECTTISINRGGTGTYPCYQNFDTISGNTASTEQQIYACAKVRSRSTNTSYPRIYLSYYKNGSLDVSYYNLASIDGKSGVELNDDEWHTLSYKATTFNSMNNDYFTFNRIAFGVYDGILNDEIAVKDIVLINLTELFGRGHEPTKEWCDQYLIGLWNMYEFPKYSEMQRIRQNLVSITQKFTYITAIHGINTLNYWNYYDANNWEQILYETNKMIKSFENYQVYSGVCNSGQNRVWQHRFRILYPFMSKTWQELIYTYWDDIPQNKKWIDLIAE